MFSFCLLSCNSENKSSALSVDEIIQFAIQKSGTEQFINSKVQFKFRGKTYTSIPTCKGFKYSREYKIEDNKIKDELYQNKFQRRINNTKIEVSDSLAFIYSESINSVFYFVQLPYRLQDNAVNKELIGVESDSLNEFYKIKVDFKQEGGGEDFEDVYFYWINTTTFQIEYLAYSFQVNGGGIRFRKVIDSEKINSIQFLTFENYQPKENNLLLQNSLTNFKDNKYELLSLIENDSITVHYNEKKCNE